MTVNNLAVLERDDGHLDRVRGAVPARPRQLRRALGARHPHAVLAANRRAVEGDRELAARPQARPTPQETTGESADDVGAACATPARPRRPRGHGGHGGGTAAGGRRHPGRPRRRHPRSRRRRRPSRPTGAARHRRHADGCCCPAASTRTCTCTSKASTRASPPGSTTTRADRRPRWRAASPASATCRTCCRGRASRIACAREESARRAAGDRRRVLPHRHRAPQPRRSSTRSARAVRGRPAEHEDLHVHADVRRQRPAVHARHEGRGRRGRHHARPLRGSGHHRVLHDHARPTTRTAISATSPTAARSRRRRSPPNARSRCAGRRARRRTSCTCRRRARWPPARRRARRACRCSSRRGRFTCT